MTKVFNGITIVLDGNNLGKITSDVPVQHLDKPKPQCFSAFLADHFTTTRGMPVDPPTSAPAEKSEPPQPPIEATNIWWDGPDLMVEDAKGMVWRYTQAYCTDMQVNGTVEENGVTITSMSYMLEPKE